MFGSLLVEGLLLSKSWPLRTTFKTKILLPGADCRQSQLKNFAIDETMLTKLMGSLDKTDFIVWKMPRLLGSL